MLQKLSLEKYAYLLSSGTKVFLYHARDWNDPEWKMNGQKDRVILVFPYLKVHIENTLRVLLE